MKRSGTWGIRASSLVLSAGLVAGCGRGAGDDGGAEIEPVLIGTENLAIVRRESIRTGPRLSGSLEPRERAQVRAEVGGTVTRVEADRGEAVRAGALLASIDDGSAEQAYASARSAVNSAQTSLDIAQRQAQRTEALVEGGALAERDLDLALAAVAQARSQLDAAQAQLATAAERLENTSVRAPITGVVAARAVSIGDVVSPGAALFTVIDPSSMRLEAEVPSAALGELSVGTPVQFAVRGYPNQLFQGEVVAISPAADPVTRQIPITVSIPNPGNRLVAGLFAEGRIGTESAEGLVAPTSAVDLNAAAPTVLRLTDGRAEEVAVDIGIVDTETERVQFISGVEAGDTLLIGAARAITPGTPVRVESIGDAAPSGV